MLARPAASLAVLLLAAAARGQEPLFVSPFFPTGASPHSVSSGDLDDDGLPDLVVSRDGGLLSIQLNLDGESFGAPSTITVTNLTRRTALADYDGDGDLDIALAVDAPTLELVNLYRGVGDGTFLSPLFSVTADGPNDLEAADLDADGDQDLAVACTAGNRVSVLLGDGDATFAPHADVGTLGSTRGLSLGLLNDDEHIDIAVTGFSVGLRTLLGDGAGAFALVPGTVGIGPAWDDVDLGDANADGLFDALLAGDTPQMGLALGAGDGTFAEPVMTAVPSNSLQPVLADVDEDGDADALCLSSAQDFAVNVALSPGDGTLQAPARYGTAGQVQDFAVDDFNGDGDLDLLPVSFGGFVPSRGTLLTGDGAGGFGPQYKLVNGTRELDAGDIDGDGRLDLISAGFDSSFCALLGGDFGGFGSAVVHTTPGFDPTDVMLGDLVEDGQADAVVPLVQTISGGPLLRVYAADGSSALFASPVSIALPSTPQLGALADLDADGHLDVILGFSDSTVRTWRGDGAGGLSVADVQAAASSPRGVATGDLDADGVTDVVAGVVTAFVHVYLGDGDGTLQPPLTFPTVGGSHSSVALGDLDGDDDVDVVLASESSGAGLSLLSNDGRGFLSAPQTLVGVLNAYGVAVADVTHDGVPDVVGTGGHPQPIQAEGEIVVWEGLGGGAFGAAQLHAMSSTAAGLVVRDFDGDGWLDAAAASLQDDVSVRLNRRGPWDDLGHPLAGELGLPRQRGRGTLQPAEFFEFRLTDARPGGLTGHIIGLSAIDAPFKGGVMVPAPLLINFPLPIDAQGDLSLQGAWPGPAGATGVQLYFQFWGPDPAGIKGFAASNAVRGTLP
jgi:FG-GAP-like repeat